MMLSKEIALKVAFWVLASLTVVLIVWFLVGNSPPAESIVLTVFATLITHLYHQLTDVNKRLANIEADVRVIKDEIRDLKEMLRGN